MLDKYKERLKKLAGLTTSAEKQKVKKLYVFDFDGTLVKTPLPEDGIPEWRAFYQKQYPHQGWWSKPESLDIQVFNNLDIVQETIRRYKEIKNEPNSIKILLTSRISKLEYAVKRILEQKKLFFDRYIFKDGKEEKKDKLNSLLEEYPNINYVEIWDDRDKEINRFQEWKKTKHITVVIHQINSLQSQI